MRRTRIARFLAQRLPQAEDEILVAYARLLADQYAALNRDPAACFTYATRGSDAHVMALLGADLQRRELALTERVMRSRYRRTPPSADALQAANAAVSQVLFGQFDAAAINLLAEPAKVRRRSTTLLPRRQRACAPSPTAAALAGELMSSLFTRK